MSGMAKCTDVGADICAVQRQGAEAKCTEARVNAQQSGSREYRKYGAAHTGAALTCSEDETITRVLCTLSQVPASVSSSTSSTAVLDLSPWLHSLGCCLPQLVGAGDGSCK
jgi:hypothetical protein